MKTGKYNELISETSPFPGSIGDSLAESSRAAMLFPEYDFNWPAFITYIGFLRHPDSPWRENDTSWDQLIPFYLMCKKRGYNGIDQMVRTSKNTPMKNPTVWALLNNHKLLLSICILIQGLLFKLPYRWDDGKKWFSKNDSSCDYLNYFWIGLECYQWAIIVPMGRLMVKIESYYQAELAASEDPTLVKQLLALYYIKIASGWK